MVRIGEADEGQAEPPSEHLLGGVTDIHLLRWLNEQFLNEVPVSLELLPGKDLTTYTSDQLEYFLRRIREGYLDFVAISMKDVHEALPEGLTLAAVVPRQDPREALLTRRCAAQTAGEPAPTAMTTAGSLADLPPGAVVCAPSRRRRLLIESRYPHLVVDSQRTSMQNRLRLIREGQWDACVCAVAELDRWGLAEVASAVQTLEPEELMPAFGQGAVGLLCRARDEAAIQLLGQLDDPAARACIECERLLVANLAIPDGAAVGGLAELLPDGKLRLRCMVLEPAKELDPPALSLVKRVGDAADVLAKKVAKELRTQEPPSLLPGDSASSSSVASEVFEDTDQDEAEQDDDALLWREEDQVLPPVAGASQRKSLAEVDATGRHRYEARVCAVFPQGNGALLDLNFEVPARWYPERPTVQDTPSLVLGSTVDVYCCRKVLGKEQQLQVLLEQPPQLQRRGSVERMRLCDLSPGKGPFRAVVVSSSVQGGALVDFNCEAFGKLNTSVEPQKCGTDLRVYCHEVDEASGTCVVGDRPWSPTSSTRMQLEQLANGMVEAYQGTVRNDTAHGYFVDFNCEVNGLLDPMDIDPDLCPEGLTVGCQVRVYVSMLDLGRRTVRLTMFRPRQAARVARPGRPSAARSKGRRELS